MKKSSPPEKEYDRLQAFQNSEDLNSLNGEDFDKIAQQVEELRNFERLFHLSNDLVFVCNPEGYFTKVNPAFKKILGWDTSYLLNHSITEFAHPDDVPVMEKEMEKLNAGLQTINYIQRFKTSDNNYRLIEYTSSPDSLTGNIFGIGRDITDTKEKEAKLASSEAQLRNLFDNSQGLMCTHDMEGNFITFNTPGANSLGYTNDELKGKNLADIVLESRRPYLYMYLDAIKQEGRSKGQMTVMHKDGSTRYWMYNNVVTYDSEGKPYVVGNATDVTDMYLLKADLQSTKEMLEQTNKVAKVGGWQFDIIKGIINWSSITKEIHGVGPDYVPELGTGLDFYKDEESRSKVKSVIERAIQTGQPWNHELQITTVQGRDLWIRSIGNAEMVEGVCKRLYGTFQDIDEQKKIELEVGKSRGVLAAFVEHAPAAVAMLDTNMNYIAVSNRWIKDYLLEDKNVIGESYYRFFTIDQESKDRHQRVLKGAVERNDEELIHLPGLGEDVYVAWEMRPWYQLNGSIGGMMMFIQNITALILQREELKVAKIQADQANVAKSEFLANMSHEIRTPLNGIIGFTDLVLKTNLNDTQQQYLSIVNQSANALLSIINDILDFSKIEAGKLELELERCDLYEMASQATDIITYQVQTRGLEMLLNISPDLPRFIWTDSVRLKQILINLLSNAAKFTEHGEIELKIEALKSTGDQTTIRFGVRDTGIGIPHDKQHKIFEAFAQEDGSTTKKYGGTGLGLTISNKLLNLMDSQLQLTSKLREGSVFYFDVVMKTEQGEPIEWENIDMIKKVLIVDDNNNNRDILRQMLLLKNINSAVAENGLEALQLLAKGETYDVILMDYHMPYMDGLETIRKIREEFDFSPEEQPIILLYSSSDDEKVIKACNELKVNYRLVKPVKMQDIYSILSRIHQKGVKVVDGPLKEAAAEANTDRITVLVAEDNAVNMLLARTILKNIAPNATLLEAKNGVEALAYCKRELPDLILMDVQMPDMNGYEATRHIRLLPNGTDVPIIALTAGNVKSEREKCLAAGMDDFVVKPVIEDTIALVLKKWLHTDKTPALNSNEEDITDIKKHFDIDKIKSYVGSEPQDIAELLALMRRELTDSAQMLTKYKDEQNLKELNLIGHELYGMAVSTGLSVLANASNKLEHLKQWNTAEYLVETILAEIQVVLNLMH